MCELWVRSLAEKGPRRIGDHPMTVPLPAGGNEAYVGDPDTAPGLQGIDVKFVDAYHGCVSTRSFSKRSHEVWAMLEVFAVWVYAFCDKRLAPESCGCTLLTQTLSRSTLSAERGRLA